MLRTAFASFPPLVMVIAALILSASLGVLAAVFPPAALVLAAALVVGSLGFATRTHSLNMGILYLLIVMIVFTSAIPRGRFLPVIALNELFLILALGLAVLYTLVYRRRIHLPGALVAAIAFLMVGTVLAPLLSYPLRGETLSFSSILELVAPLQYLGLFWLFAVIPQTLEEKRALIQLLLLCASVAALIGLLQAANIGPVFSFLESWYPSSQQGAAAETARVTSVLAAWNALGMFLSVNLLLISAIYPDESRPLYQWNMRVATVLLLACLVATNLYSGLITFVVGFILIKMLDPRGLRIAAAFAVLGAIAALIQLPSILQRLSFQLQSNSFLPQTLEYRLAVWQEVFFPLIAKHLWWGVSPDFSNLTFGFPESQYIFLLFRSGLVSLAAFLLWLLILMVWLWHRSRVMAPSFERSLLIVVFVQLVTFSLVGLINPVFTYSGSIDILWIVLGLIASTQLTSTESTNEQLKGSKWREPQ